MSVIVSGFLLIGALDVVRRGDRILLGHKRYGCRRDQPQLFFRRLKGSN